MNTNVLPNAKIEAKITITLSEDEARALDAIFGYCPKAFIRGFYVQLGKHYLKPYEHAVPGMFESVQQQLRPGLARIDKARNVFDGIQ